MSTNSLTVRKNRKIAKLKRLNKDIEKRNYLLAYLRKRSLVTLADKYKLSQSTIWIGEKTLIVGLSHRQNAEIRQSRKEYYNAKKAMPRYSKKSIERRNNIASGSFGIKEEQLYKLES
jgi:hypothetical protein